MHRHGTWPASRCGTSSVRRAKRHAGARGSAQTLGSRQNRFGARHAAEYQNVITAQGVGAEHQVGQRSLFSHQESHRSGSSSCASAAGHRRRWRRSAHQPRSLSWLGGLGSGYAMCIAKPIRFGGALVQAKPGCGSSQVCGLSSGCSMLLSRAAAVCHEQTRCLTLRSRGRPPASQLGREALAVYHPPRGQAVSPASAPQLKR